jgi:hypothetical protein
MPLHPDAFERIVDFIFDKHVGMDILIAPPAAKPKRFWCPWPVTG